MEKSLSHLSQPPRKSLFSRYRWVVYFVIALTLVLIWYGPYLISKRVGILDTPKDLYFFAYIGQSLKAGEYPFFFIAPPGSVARYPTLKNSHAAFANPEVYSFSPDIIFLPFTSAARFVKLHFGLHLLAGIFGVYLLSKRLKLRIEFALGLVLLLLLNPWYTQHLAIGYYPWVNAALFPLIAALLIPEQGRRYDFYFAGLINALMLYQGGIHVFSWFNGAVLLVSIFACLKYTSPRPALRVLGFYIVTVFAALPKLLLGFTIYGGMAQPIHASYNNLRGLWAVLTDNVTYPYELPQAYTIHNIAWYDGSLYMGVAFIVLVFVSVILACVNQKWKVAIDEMLIPCIILIVLSWGLNWLYIVFLFDNLTEALLGRPIYILHAEKYPWRFLFLSVILVSAFAMTQLSDFVSRIKKPKARVLLSVVFCALLLVIGRDLFLRNRYFSKVATQEDPKVYLQNWNLKNHTRTVPIFDARFKPISPIWLAASFTPNKIELPPGVFYSTDTVVLPWLKASDIPLFRISNCKIGQIMLSRKRSFVTIENIDQRTNVVLTYDKTLFFIALAIGLLGLMIIFAIPAVAGYLKKNANLKGRIE